MNPRWIAEKPGKKIPWEKERAREKGSFSSDNGNRPVRERSLKVGLFIGGGKCGGRNRGPGRGGLGKGE